MLKEMRGRRTKLCLSKSMVTVKVAGQDVEIGGALKYQRKTFDKKLNYSIERVRNVRKKTKRIVKKIVNLTKKAYDRNRVFLRTVMFLSGGTRCIIRQRDMREQSRPSIQCETAERIAKAFPQGGNQVLQKMDK